MYFVASAYEVETLLHQRQLEHSSELDKSDSV